MLHTLDRDAEIPVPDTNINTIEQTNLPMDKQLANEDKDDFLIVDLPDCFDMTKPLPPEKIAAMTKAFERSMSQSSHNADNIENTLQVAAINVDINSLQEAEEDFQNNYHADNMSITSASTSDSQSYSSADEIVNVAVVDQPVGLSLCQERQQEMIQTESQQNQYVENNTTSQEVNSTPEQSSSVTDNPSTPDNEVQNDSIGSRMMNFLDAVSNGAGSLQNAITRAIESNRSDSESGSDNEYQVCKFI